MKTKYAILGFAIALLSPLCHADTCAAGSFAALIGTPCTIGGTTFTFSSSNGGYDPTQLTFTPLSTTTSSGFNISGFAAVTTAFTEDYFIDYFTAVPLNGTFTSFGTTLNGVSQSGSTYLESDSLLYDSSAAQADDVNQSYGYGTHESTLTGAAEPSFNGDFELYNYTYSNGSSAGFTSADFVFNESTPTNVPEGPETAMLGIGIAAMLFAIRNKYSQGFRRCWIRL